MLSPPEYIFEMLKNSLQLRAHEVHLSVNRSRGREANVACDVCCCLYLLRVYVCVCVVRVVCVRSEKRRPVLFSGKFCTERFPFLVPITLSATLCHYYCLPYLLKVFVCFELPRGSILTDFTSH